MALLSPTWQRTVRACPTTRMLGDSGLIPASIACARFRQSDTGAASASRQASISCADNRRKLVLCWKTGIGQSAPNPEPGLRYSSRGGAKISRTLHPFSPARMVCGTPPGVRQKSPFENAISSSP